MRFHLLNRRHWFWLSIAALLAVSIGAVFRQTPYRQASKNSPYGPLQSSAKSTVPEHSEATPLFEILPLPQDADIVAASVPWLGPDFWKKVPTIEAPPRAGWPVLPPAGPGYY